MEAPGRSGMEAPACSHPSPRLPGPKQLLDELETRLDAEGLDLLSRSEGKRGDLVRPRRFEVAAALSRWRAAQFRQ